PFYCNSHQSAACNKADSQNWSRVVLVSQTGSVLPAPGGSPVAGTTSYSYTLASFVASPCSDCTVGYYWGNQKDGDFLDYYNGKFMGFAQARVVKPDNALEIHKYHSTLGWGVYDTTQIDKSYCTSP